MRNEETDLFCITFKEEPLWNFVMTSRLTGTHKSLLEEKLMISQEPIHSSLTSPNQLFKHSNIYCQRFLVEALKAKYFLISN